MKPLVSTVLVAAASHDLVTLDDLREHLKIKPNTTDSDDWLRKAISRSSRQAEKHCGRIFVAQTYRDTFPGGIEGDKGEPLRLGQAPVEDLTSFTVTIDGAAADAGGYVVDQTGGIVYRTADPFIWSSSGSLVVEYVGGFAVIPDDLQEATLLLCTAANSGRGRDPMLRAKESPGMGREEFWVGGAPGGETIPLDIAGKLWGYVRGMIG